MPNTTPPAFAAIDSIDLATVQGGCGGKKRCCKCTNTNITNNFITPPAQGPVASAPDTTAVSVTYA